MIVMILERVKPSTRGELTRWMLEPHPGVFVGTLSGMVREKLWVLVCASMKGGGAATLIYTADTEQGFAMRTIGDTSRVVVDLEGLQLVKFPKTRIK